MDRPISLSSLFQKKVFRVPDYQRGYAWQEDQLKDFFEDLVNIPKSQKHYTGMVAIQNMKTVSDDSQWLVDDLDFSPYCVVDGQQRLTTAVILISEIVHYAKVHGYDSIGEITIDEIIGQYLFKTRKNGNIRGFIFNYVKRDKNTEFYESILLDSPIWDVANDTFYIHNLRAAKKFFRENIDNYCGQDTSEQAEKLNDLFKKLVNSMTFNTFEIENQEDVYVIFETMNNRGKKLSNLELLKNRLIYLSTLVEDYDVRGRDNLREKINEAWAEVYKQLGSNPEKSLSDDDFLRDHWVIYFRYSRNKGSEYIKDLLERFSHKKIYKNIAILEKPDEVCNDTVDDCEFTDGSTETAQEDQLSNEDLSAEFIDTYVESLKNTAQYWNATFFPERSNIIDDSIKHRISQMNHLGMGYFRPLITSMLLKYSANTDKTQLLQETIAAMERFSYIYFTLGHNNASGYSTEFYNMARFIYYEKDSDDNLFGMENVLKRLKEVTESNREYCLEAFSNRMDKYFKNGDGYYNWKGKYYFFYEYEGEKRGDDESKLSWDSYYSYQKGTVSIEHILPQHSGTTAKKALEEDIQYWNDRFGVFTDEERYQLTGAIGNLLALSKNVNSALQNHSYPKKTKPEKEGRDRGYYNGSYSEIEVAAENDDWTADSIYKRSVKLLGFMNEHWELGLSEEQIKQLVHLKFIAQ